MKLNFKLFVFVMLVSHWVGAQIETTMPFMRGLNQSTFVNPAFIPKYGTSVGVPVFSNIYIGTTLHGASIGDYANAIEDDTVLNLTTVFEKSNTNTFGLGIHMQYDLFHVTFPVGRYFVGVSSSLKINQNTEFDKGFLGIPVSGNMRYAGRSVSFGGNDFDFTSYGEVGLSVAREFEKFSIGIRGKYLIGLANASTSDITSSIQMGDEVYDPITLKLGGKVNFAGFPLTTDSSNAITNSDVDIMESLTRLKNNGYGVDFGFTYWVTPRLNVHASVIDLGFINWTSDVINSSYDNVEITYIGTNYEQIDNEEARTRYTDSITGLFDKGATITRDAYTTMLPTRYFVGADYDLTLRDKVGVLFQGRQGRNFHSAVTLSYSRRFGTNFDVAANYSYINGSFVNLGLGTSIKAGAFQLYLVQDNILFYMLPAASRTFNLRFGFNLVWGEIRRPVRF